MGILNIRKAKRVGAKVVIGVAGPSGSGKTLTALYIARGMVDRPEEIGFLDTENGRGSLYADELDEDFLIADLYPPFTPDRYSAAIKEFQNSGVKVLIIDSVTHEWEGTGGCIEIADKAGKMGWNVAKAHHKKFMNVLLQSDMDVIVCVRARQQMDFRNPNKPVDLGIQPVQEKNFMFEMTASVMMFNEGMNQQHLKIPKDLKPVFGDGNSYIGQEQGRAIREWINSGDKIDEAIQSAMNKLTLSSNDGMSSLESAWMTIDSSIKPKLKNHLIQCKHSARAFDSLNTNPDKIKNKTSLAEQLQAQPEKAPDIDTPSIENTPETDWQTLSDQLIDAAGNSNSMEEIQEIVAVVQSHDMPLEYAKPVGEACRKRKAEI